MTVGEISRQRERERRVGGGRQERDRSREDDQEIDRSEVGWPGDRQVEGIGDKQVKAG